MKVLDLFCCGGGATKGFQNAGFYVHGVDRDDNSKYYVGDEFTHSDVFDIDIDWMATFDLIWASPPCQKYSQQTKQHLGAEDNHEDLVARTRDMLDFTGRPYVIENVPNAPVRKDLVLCGKMFDLDVARHRHFEISGFSVKQPEHKPHDGRIITVTGHAGGSSKRDGASRFGSTQDWKDVMEIDWLPGRLIKEAIPPRYSEYIGNAFIDHILELETA